MPKKNVILFSVVICGYLTATLYKKRAAYESPKNIFCAQCHILENSETSLAQELSDPMMSQPKTLDEGGRNDTIHVSRIHMRHKV